MLCWKRTRTGVLTRARVYSIVSTSDEPPPVHEGEASGTPTSTDEASFSTLTAPGSNPSTPARPLSPFSNLLRSLAPADASIVLAKLEAARHDLAVNAAPGGALSSTVGFAAVGSPAATRPPHSTRLRAWIHNRIASGRNATGDTDQRDRLADYAGVRSVFRQALEQLHTHRGVLDRPPGTPEGAFVAGEDGSPVLVLVGNIDLPASDGADGGAAAAAEDDRSPASDWQVQERAWFGGEGKASFSAPPSTPLPARASPPPIQQTPTTRDASAVTSGDEAASDLRTLAILLYYAVTGTELVYIQDESWTLPVQPLRE